VRDALLRTEPDYREAMDSTARAIGVELDSIELEVDVLQRSQTATSDFCRSPQGGWPASMPRWEGIVAGERVIELRMVWELGGIFGRKQEPSWQVLHGYRIRIDGDPNVNMRLSFAPEDFSTFDIGSTTAMPAINAIWAVVAAPAGGLTPADISLVTARYRPAG